MDNREIIYEKIKAAPIITIWGHGQPDGDCYGCQIGLRELIKNTWPEKKVYAIGSGIKPLFERLSPMDEVDQKTIEESLGILVDVSCLRRVEDSRVFACRDFTKFDHHLYNAGNAGEDFPHDSIMEPGRISAAEIVCEFAREFHMTFSRLAAEALFLGMATDSGRFQFYGTCAKTFEDCAFLFQFDVRPYSLLNIVYQDDVKTTLFRAYMIEHTKIEGKVAYCILKREDDETQGMSYDRASSMVNVLATFNTPMFALFTSAPDGSIRVELRSEFGYPVQPTAARFEGGGHLYAAGATLYEDHGPTAQDMIDALQEVEKNEDGRH